MPPFISCFRDFPRGDCLPCNYTHSTNWLNCQIAHHCLTREKVLILHIAAPSGKMSKSFGPLSYTARLSHLRHLTWAWQTKCWPTKKFSVKIPWMHEILQPASNSSSKWITFNSKKYKAFPVIILFMITIKGQRPELIREDLDQKRSVSAIHNHH